LADRRTDLATKLRLVRRYTGDKFSAARGYDLRHPLSKSRARTIAKYFDLIAELTSRPHTLYKPQRGEKREAFAYTGQIHAPRFAVAIVETPQPNDRYAFSLDRSRPKGSRFTVTNRRTGERATHIPAGAFLDENEALYDEDAELEAAFFEGVISDYTDGRNVVLVIEAGESHMWGDAGTPRTTGEHLAQLFKTYGAGNFSPFDPASHFIGNWFNGVKVYSPDEFAPIIGAAIPKAAERQRTWNLRPGEHFRQLRSGDIGHFYKGRLLQTFPRSGFETATREHGLIKPRDG
jgi:hypothetical protein